MNDSGTRLPSAVSRAGGRVGVTIKYLIKSWKPGVLEHETPDGRGLHYASRVTAIPEMIRFIPALEHPKNLILDKQTAHVTGPKGEEIYPGKYSRVKVQFSA